MLLLLNNIDVNPAKKTLNELLESVGWLLVEDDEYLTVQDFAYEYDKDTVTFIIDFFKKAFKEDEENALAFCAKTVTRKQNVTTVKIKLADETIIIPGGGVNNLELTSLLNKAYNFGRSIGLQERCKEEHK